MTKKLLAPYSVEKRAPVGRSFAVPVMCEDTWQLVRLDTKRPVEFAAVVYTGKEITAEDLFSAIVDAGFVIPSVEGLLTMLRSYLDQVSGFKIGDVVSAETTADGLTLTRRPRGLQSRKSDSSRS